jgi:hypothetical protein
LGACACGLGGAADAAGFAGDSAGEAHGLGGVVVGGAAEAAAAVTLECDDGAGAFSRIEAAAAGGAGGVAGAGPGYELCALGGGLEDDCEGLVG